MSLSIGKKSYEQQLAEANKAFKSRDVFDAGKSEMKDVTNDDMTTVQATLLPRNISAEDAAAENFAEKYLDDQLAQGMHLMGQEAREALASDPKDEVAKVQLLQYTQWCRTRNLDPSRLVVNKKRQTRDPNARPFGTWKRTDYGWLLKVSGKAKVGDEVSVKKKGGEIVEVELIEEVAPGYFKSKDIL